MDRNEESYIDAESKKSAQNIDRKNEGNIYDKIMRENLVHKIGCHTKSRKK